MIELSLLFERGDDPRRSSPCVMPAYFIDLNLDQVIATVCAGKAEYDLERIFYRPLKSADEIEYRHEVFSDIERLRLLDSLYAFSEGMGSTRRRLASLGKIASLYHRYGWFLDTALEYCDSVESLSRVFSGLDVESRALKSFASFIAGHVESSGFKEFLGTASRLKDDLRTIRYTATIKDLTVKVRKYDGEIDYGTDIEETFQKFSQGETKSYLVKYSDSSGIDHVQAQILECVAKLYPEVFSQLVLFCGTHASFVDETIDSCERELAFYLAWLKYIKSMRDAGLSFCLPAVSSADKAVSAKGVYDIALATRSVLSMTTIVTNDFSIRGEERIVVVTGPNQGGKTTFARTFGQIHHLGSIGCHVSASEARLFLFDAMFSHFEREESLKTHRGKLHEEIVSLHDSLASATGRSIFILNEVFTSTTLMDSLFLSRKIIDKIAALDALCVCVTFLDELASLNEKVVSYVCAVDPVDPSIRTFRIERRSADGLAYARALAEKHRLTYEALKARIES